MVLKPIPFARSGTREIAFPHAVIFVTNASSATTSTPSTNVPSTGTSRGHPHSQGPTAIESGDERPNEWNPEDSRAQLTASIPFIHVILVTL